MAASTIRAVHLRAKLGCLMVGSSLLLHVATVFAYTQLPDRLAAFTAFPLWFWGGTGLALASAAYCLFKARLSLIMAFIWAITIFVGSDEARVIGHLGNQTPEPGRAMPRHGSHVLRVATLNCAAFRFGDPSADIARWDPDIVLLQELYPHQVQHIAGIVYQRRGDFRTHGTSGVATRWRIGDDGHALLNLNDHHVPVILPNGARLEVVNVHLSSAATNLCLWRPDAWREHRANRIQRRGELAAVLQFLENTYNLPDTPVLFGGDFNSSAHDPNLRLMSRDFTDAFLAAGTGWGDTFQRRVPILRIDHIYANRHFTAIRCRAVTTLHSDHRMVIADFTSPLFSR